jgi:hypothetical protein
MGLQGKQSTIDTNSNGGDCGVAEKRNAALDKLAKMKQTGMPYGRGAKLPVDAAHGGKKPK